MSYEISLLKLVENRDASLYGRLIDIRKKAEPLLSYTQGKFPYYTPHDFSHSNAVEENLNWLIPDNVKQKMHIFEIFFLIVAAWLHDWGMVGKPEENAESIRETHHIRTEKNFEELHDKLHLSEHEARIIGRICKGHRRVDLRSNEYDDIVFGQSVKIRCRFLAALLRIADECDITHNRTPEVIYYSIHPKEKAEEEFKKHLSIGGIGQLSEMHKIYIFAIATDPKGARTLREVAQKIQNELDGVKAILAENEVPLDIVELRLETRGFIDKPIAFEIDRHRIVQLLIGDHLYANQDVAIRELVQNSLDSCRIKQILEPGTSFKISLHKGTDDTIVVEDNGLGMDYIDAKQFLSTIGASFRNSESFREIFQETNYSPIAQFGIGVLSCFLICEQLTIETRKEGQEPCKFTVESLGQEWRYEKGSLSTPGTRITLKLNEYGKSINLKESIERYFLCPELPIEYREGDGGAELLNSQWTGEEVFQRFTRDDIEKEEGSFKEILRLTTDKLDVILGTWSKYLLDNMVLFNHGIHIGAFNIDELDSPYCLCINMHADFIDLLLSREGIKHNERLRAFIQLIFDHIFRDLETRYCDDVMKVIKILSSMIRERLKLYIESESQPLEKIPFMKAFLDHAPFLMLTDSEISNVRLSQVMDKDSFLLYNCCSKSLSQELDLVSQLSGKSSLLLNPYVTPFVETRHDPDARTRLLPYLLHRAGRLQKEITLRDLLIENSSVNNSELASLLPENVRLATFPEGVNPLVVVCKNAVVETRRYRMGSAYWGNILLWKQILHRERLNTYLASISELYDDRFDRVRLIQEPLVYVDQSDSFVRSLLSAKEREAFDTATWQKVLRYLKYLSYLPLVINNLESCIIFLEVIDQLETELSEFLCIERPSPLFERMKPNGKLFFDYFRLFGLSYTEYCGPGA